MPEVIWWHLFATALAVLIGIYIYSRLLKQGMENDIAGVLVGCLFIPLYLVFTSILLVLERHI